MRTKLLATVLACLPLVGCASTPNTVDPRMSAGWRRIEMRDPAGALGFFEEALESEATAENNAGRGRALFLLGRLEEARSAYMRAAELDPDETEWRMGLAVVELARGDSRAAIAACEVALEIAPSLAKAYYNRGCARLRMLEYASAEADFNRTIELDPSHAEAYNSRGVVLARTDRLEDALRDFLQSARIAPLAAAHGNSGAAYYALGETQLALSQLNLALKLDRVSPLYPAQRGRIYMDLGQSDLAAADFERALALAPGTHALAQLLAEARADQGAQDAGRLEAVGVPEPAALSVGSDE